MFFWRVIPWKTISLHFLPGNDDSQSEVPCGLITALWHSGLGWWIFLQVGCDGYHSSRRIRTTSLGRQIQVIQAWIQVYRASSSMLSYVLLSAGGEDTIFHCFPLRDTVPETLVPIFRQLHYLPAYSINCSKLAAGASLYKFQSLPETW